MRLDTLLLLLIASAAAACATIPGPAGQGPCATWPPDVPVTILTAPILGAHQGILAGTDTAATYVYYSYAPHHVALLWVGGLVALVDPDPFNQRTPAWIDRGVLTLDGERLRATPRQTCQWHLPAF